MTTSTSAPAKKTITPRQWTLAIALAATVAATLWAAQQGDDADAPAQPTAGKGRTAAPTATSAGKPAPRPAAQEAPATVNWSAVVREDWAKPADAQLAAWMPPAPPPADR